MGLFFILSPTLTKAVSNEELQTSKDMILVLHSSDSDFYWNKNEAQGFSEVFPSSQNNFNLYSEFLDLQRFTKKNHFQKVAELLLEKYKPLKNKIAGIIVADDQALQLYNQYLKKQFTDLPLVACGINGEVPPALSASQKNFGVVYEIPAYQDTIDLILKLHPKMQRLVLVSDKTIHAVGQLHQITTILQQKNIPYIHLGFGTFADTANELKKLNRGDIVIRLSYFEDSTGKVLNVEQAIKLITDNSKVPIYSFWEGYIGKGIVGGKLISGVNHGKRAAQILKQMIEQKAATTADIKISAQLVEQTHYFFDYQQLKRYAIDFNKIPVDSTIVNKPFSFYDHYKTLTWSLIITVSILLVVAFLMSWTNLKLMRAKQKLILAKEKSDEASLSKSRFLAIMSHEIRTPLAVVLGFSDLLSNRNLPDAKKADYIDKIKRSGIILSNLINDILDMSHIESGQLRIDQSTIYIKDILGDVIATTRLIKGTKNIELKAKALTDIPVSLLSDATRFRQVLTNLLNNAIKFTDTGYVQIEVYTKNNFIHFVVEDSGVGLSDEEAQKIFEPFYQADNTFKRKHGGAGLGLTISRTLAQALGGSLEFEKNLNHSGCRFNFYLPFDNSIQKWTFKNISELETPVEVVPHRLANSYTHLQGLRVLYAEDVRENQLLISTFLKTAQIHIDIAENGEEAIQKVLSEKYDLILMDIQMPVMDGIEATLKLRKMGIQIPIVALTAHALKEQKQKSLEAGFNEHLTKPIRLEPLLNTISKLVSEHTVSAPQSMTSSAMIHL